VPRLARDVAASCGKRVRLETDGAETEIDRTIVDTIRDPLTHLVRNGIDHGVEAPAVRRAAGKPEEKRLSLRAFAQGGQVLLEISDDGAGIDVSAIRTRALERRLATADELAYASESEILGYRVLGVAAPAERPRRRTNLVVLQAGSNRFAVALGAARRGLPLHPRVRRVRERRPHVHRDSGLLRERGGEARGPLRRRAGARGRGRARADRAIAPRHRGGAGHAADESVQGVGQEPVTG
jgi:hypothetical protein